MRLIDKRFVPDEFHDDIYSIDLDSLKQRGIKAVLLEIDNTLVTYDDPEPTEKVLGWLAELEKRNIRAAFISNNHRGRVERFNAGLGFPAYCDSGKPSTKYYKIALAEMGAGVDSAAVIGDQVFTDVWSGKRLGAYTVLVRPIKDKTSLFFRFKRALEKPVMRRYRKIHRQ